MAESSILFKLLNTSILEMYKVFEHIDMLSIDILSNSLNSFTTMGAYTRHLFCQAS
jgi:hypothetical protein